MSPSGSPEFSSVEDNRNLKRRLLARRQRSDQQIPGIFQFLLALYIILTGDFSTVLQATAIGLHGGGGAEFTAAMLTSIAFDLLILAPVLILARHPLGIFHPLLLAVVVWPLVLNVPKVINEYGGWSGILAGIPLAAPSYVGIPSHDPSAIWLAVAKYNGIKILALLATYVGFWCFRGRERSRTVPTQQADTLIVRTAMIGLIAVSMTVLMLFLYFRGGLTAHLASLGLGRFRTLHDVGAVIVLIHLGEIALQVWIAARPRDVKSPIFLLCAGAVTAALFISNGSRGSALRVPLTLGLIWAIRRRSVPWKMALALLPFLFLSVGLLGAIRTSSWSNQTAAEAFQQTGLAESFARTQQEIEERRALSAQIPIIERGFEVSNGPLYGKSYAAALTAFIPRVLWEDKPRGPDSLYAQLFLHQPKEGVAIPVTPEAEMYWNFGLPAVALLSIIYGALLRASYNFFWMRQNNAFALVLYLIVITEFQFSTRKLVDLQQDLGLLLLCYIAVKVLSPRPNYAPSPPRGRIVQPVLAIASGRRTVGGS